MGGIIIERCPSGIEGFDRISQGGFVRNSTNVVIGGPGSGKTTFLLQFLWNGASKFNENGIYCSFEPDIVETLKDGMSFGWDFSKLNESDKVKFLKFSPKTTISDLKIELTKLISRYNVKRICFDPVSVLSLGLDTDAKIRETMFDLASLMKRLNVTTLLADEALESENIESAEMSWSKTDIIKFLSDSVIVFYESGISGVSDRAVRITKMRRTSHERKPVGMKISHRGVEVISKEDEDNNTQVMPPSPPQMQSPQIPSPQKDIPPPKPPAPQREAPPM